VCPDSEGPALAILGQLTAYATSILSAQYRTHTFMVFIVKDYARLIRWDRSGAVFTKPIYFNNEPHLIDFFIRYDIADREARGHDITVSSASSQDVALAQANVPELRGANECLDVTISNQHFIIPTPESMLQVDIPVGRWTRVSFAYNKHNGCRVLLKDSWRILAEGVNPEGEIYRLLHEKRVPNIPSYSLADDVGNETYHRSQTDEIVNNQNLGLHDHRPHQKLTPHRHYRIVLHTIGKKLKDFNCTREFVQAMYAALKGKMPIFLAVRLPNLTHIIAHKAAYGAGVLHRDISPSNILIFGEGERGHSDDKHELTIDGGVLIDWDLAKIICENDKDNTTRQHARTVS
jgi:thiamine kinase-like enzyme